MYKRFEVMCSVDVSEDDVWDYLEEQGEDIEELQEEGHELTPNDWRDTAERIFLDDDFTYYDFVEIK